MKEREMNIAVVAIGYNRKSDFERLIDSLINANYGGDKVDLIMSIDNSGCSDVENYANTVEWPHGGMFVKTYKTRLGLKKHILSCGNFVEAYDAIAVFEDDIVASPGFYIFAKQCVKKYSSDDNIAGISLYTHLQNVYAKYNFIPSPSKYDVYFQQMAQSWGQVWLRKQWKDFVSWLENTDFKFEASPFIPTQLKKWGENSWLKYHILYCIEKNKYFVYPYESLTTCFSSKGEHSLIQNDVYQVPMRLCTDYDYKLPCFGENEAVYYDAFFERKFDISKILNISEENILIDLYGMRDISCQQIPRYILTSRKYPYKIVKEYACTMRPHENNIVFDVRGDHFRLYDTSNIITKGKREADNTVYNYIYYHKIFSNTKALIKTTFLIIINQAKIKLMSIRKR